MPMSHFENIRVVLAEPNADFRAHLQNHLLNFGFRNVVSTGNLSSIAKAVKEGSVDLIIADTSLPEGDLNEYVTELRHGEHGKNPFLVVISMVNEASRAVVHAAINSGTDHVLAKPFDVSALIDKVSELTQGRKKFVVTTDYIGPDRRAAHRPGTMEVPLIDVPNPLLNRKLGGASDLQVQRRIDSTMLVINEQKVLRNAYQIGWLLDFVMPEIAALNSGIEGAEPEHLLKLHKTTKDMCKRIRSTRFVQMTEMCMTLNRMAEQAITHGLGQEDMQLMGRMAGILENVFDPDRDERATEYSRNRRETVIAADEGAKPQNEADKTLNLSFSGMAIA